MSNEILLQDAPDAKIDEDLKKRVEGFIKELETLQTTFKVKIEARLNINLLGITPALFITDSPPKPQSKPV